MDLRLPIAAAAAALFVALAYAVMTHGALTAPDAGIVLWFAGHRSAALDVVMSAASLSGSAPATAIYAGIVIVLYLLRRRVQLALTVAVVVYGGDVLNFIVKQLAHRPRPPVHGALDAVTMYSFPSGHATASTLIGGLACVFAWRAGMRGARYSSLVACIVVWIALVCVSRMYLGFHYPTDVLAGVALAALWLTIATPAGKSLRWLPRERYSAGASRTR